jgi:hypothetical protein
MNVTNIDARPGRNELTLLVRWGKSPVTTPRREEVHMGQRKLFTPKQAFV